MISLVLMLHIIKKAILGFIDVVLSLPIMMIAMISDGMLDVKLQQRKRRRDK